MLFILCNCRQKFVVTAHRQYRHDTTVINDIGNKDTANTAVTNNTVSKDTVNTPFINDIASKAKKRSTAEKYIIALTFQ